MEKSVEDILDNMIEAYPALEICRDAIAGAYEMLTESYKNGGKVLICGNGGSAADAEHIVGELMKGFIKKRPIPDRDRAVIMNMYGDRGEYLAKHLQCGLPAISLVSHSALSTAFINDVAADMVFAQQVYGYGHPGDILIAMSTSGNAENTVNAVMVANALGISSIGLAGENGGRLKQLCELCISVPASQTYKIQEYHLPVYHALCAMIEEHIFEK